LLFCLLKQIIGQLSADCQMADTDYRQTGLSADNRCTSTHRTIVQQFMSLMSNYKWPVSLGIQNSRKFSSLLWSLGDSPNKYRGAKKCLYYFEPPCKQTVLCVHLLHIL